MNMSVVGLCSVAMLDKPQKTFQPPSTFWAFMKKLTFVFVVNWGVKGNIVALRDQISSINQHLKNDVHV